MKQSKECPLSPKVLFHPTKKLQRGDIPQTDRQPSRPIDWTLIQWKLTLYHSLIRLEPFFFLYKWMIWTNLDKYLNLKIHQQQQLTCCPSAFSLSSCCTLFHHGSAGRTCFELHTIITGYWSLVYLHLPLVLSFEGGCLVPARTATLKKTILY